jgi:hypothetical protein
MMRKSRENKELENKIKELEDDFSGDELSKLVDRLSSDEYQFMSKIIQEWDYDGVTKSIFSAHNEEYFVPRDAEEYTFRFEKTIEDTDFDFNIRQSYDGYTLSFAISSFFRDKTGKIIENELDSSEVAPIIKFIEDNTFKKS